MDIRLIEKEDAKQVVDLMIKLESESDYLLYEQGEREANYQDQVENTGSFVQNKDRTILLACEADVLVGYLLIARGFCNRNRYTAHLVIGVLQFYQGKGIGTKLLEAGKEWSIKHGILRLGLTVMVHNLAAISLYTKYGFVCEGVRKESLCVNGEWIDELYMACFLC